MRTLLEIVMDPELMRTAAQFGVAGLMGVLWVWERMYSRRRERQLSEAHEQIVRADGQLGVLMQLVRRNTRAVVEFERTQKRVCHILEEIQRGLDQTR